MSAFRLEEAHKASFRLGFVVQMGAVALLIGSLAVLKIHQTTLNPPGLHNLRKRWLWLSCYLSTRLVFSPLSEKRNIEVCKHDLISCSQLGTCYTCMGSAKTRNAFTHAPVLCNLRRRLQWLSGYLANHQMSLFHVSENEVAPKSTILPG